MAGNFMAPLKRTSDNHQQALFALLCVCFAAAIIGDNAAEALLLSHIGPALLPRMFLFNAIALFLASGCIMSIIDRVDRGALFLYTTLGHGALLALVRLALESEAGWLYPLLFTYAYIAKVLLFLLFWTLANDLIDSRSAQKRFPVIAAGGTLGAIAIAFSVPAMVRLFAAENLLFVWSGLSILLGAMFMPLRARAGKAFKPASDRERHRGRTAFGMLADVKLVAADPLLSGMAYVYGLVFFLLIVQHYFFYIAIKSHFVTSERIAGFLGFFSGASMVITLVLQLSVAGALLRRFGSSRAVLLLPFSLIAIFVSQAIAADSAPAAASYALFVTIVAAMGVRVAVFDAFFSPNFQLFFSSLPRELRGRAKLTLEGVVKPIAILSAGLWLIIIAPRISFTLNMAIGVCIAALLLVQTLCLKARYASSLIRFLSGVSRNSLLAGIVKGGSDRSLVAQVRRLFEEGDFEIRKFVIDTLAVSGVPDLVALVAGQVRHADPRIRATVVAALGTVAQKEAGQAIRSCLYDSDALVVANAVSALGRSEAADAAALLESFLSHPYGFVRSNAVVALWRSGVRDRLPVFLERLDAMLDCSRPDECASALFALGEIDAPQSAARCNAFAGENGPERLNGLMPVFRELVTALGKKQDAMSLETLITMVPRSDRLQKRAIAAALTRMIERGMAPERLLEHAGKGSPGLSSVVVRAVYESRIRLLKEARNALAALVRRELETIARDEDSLAGLLPHTGAPGVALLRHAIAEERVEAGMETMASALALLDASDTIRPVVPRLFYRDPHVRGRACEVLDNAGDIGLNREVMKVFDRRRLSGDTGKAILPVVSTVAGLRGLIQQYAGDADVWVRKCAALALDGVGAAGRSEFGVSSS
jgi:AAA family ATP:ADP antiporter